METETQILKRKKSITLSFDLKTVFMVLAFFGVSGTGLLGGGRLALWWVIAPVMQAKADSIVVHERIRTDSTINVSIDSVTRVVAQEFDTLEELLMQIPQIAKAAQKRDSLARVERPRIFPKKRPR